MSNTVSAQQLPHMWCDYNAADWSGEPNAPCSYVFDTDVLQRISPSEDVRMFLFDYDHKDQTMIVRGEATLKSHNGERRARPNTAPWSTHQIPELPISGENPL